MSEALESIGRPEELQKSDLQAFKDLFGEYRNAQNGIFNTMSDLAETVARDEFYTGLKKSSENIAKQLKMVAVGSESV